MGYLEIATVYRIRLDSIPASLHRRWSPVLPRTHQPFVLDAGSPAEAAIGVNLQSFLLRMVVTQQTPHTGTEC